MRERIRRRGLTILLLAVVMLILTAWILLYVVAPSPTVLVVSVVDAEAGDPLAGVSVRVRTGDGQALPVGNTDETGRVRFQDLSPGPDHYIRVQKLDYALALKSGVIVTQGQETQIAVALTSNPGSRLFVGLDGGMIAEIDTASLLVVRVIHLAGEQEQVNHLITHPSENLLYAVASVEGYILDTQSWTLLAEFQAEGIVESVSTDGKHLCLVTGRDADANVSLSARLSADGALRVMAVSDGNDVSGQLLTLDADTGAMLTSRSTVDSQLAFQLIWRPNGTEVYVIDPFGRSLWALGASPRQVLAHTPTGAYPKEGFLSADGHYRYTWATAFVKERQGIRRVDWIPVLPQRSVPLTRVALALSPTHRGVYVLDARLGTLSILDPTGVEPRIVMPMGKQPVALAVSADGTRAYVANRKSQTISVVHLPTSSVVDTIPVPGEPLSLAVR
jgi:YVTN family beta-propeller protein